VVPHGQASSFDGADTLRTEIVRRIDGVLRSCGVSEHEVSCVLTGTHADLTIEIDGPALLQDVRHALVVRTLDAVHAHGQTFGVITVLLPST
jgi:hypothetical protein